MDFIHISLKLDSISEQVSNIREQQARMEAILEVNTENLKDHMKRTDLAEQRIDMLEKESSKWKGALWAASIACGVLSGLATLVVQVMTRH